MSAPFTVRHRGLIKAEILADSIHPFTRSRLTTMRITYPRFVHAEFMTHRMFARNASSSRAIPSKRVRAMIRKLPAVPAEWGRNQAGMQAGAPLAPWRELFARFVWGAVMQVALLGSWLLDAIGCHKQIVNRVTEPWGTITVIVTGTDAAFANFYTLRRHKDADPTIRELAEAMCDVHKTSRPRELTDGAWHLPLVDDDEVKEIGAALAAKCSAARCARTSYLNHDGSAPSVAKDIALFTRLVGSVPVHASPLEHQAMASPFLGVADAGCFGAGTGWLQLRKTIATEVSTALVPSME